MKTDYRDLPGLPLSTGLPAHRDVTLVCGLAGHQAGAQVVGLLQFGSELWSGPEPPRTGPKFGPGFGVGAEPDRRSGSGFGVGPNLAEPFRTGSEPRTGRSAYSSLPFF